MPLSRQAIEELKVIHRKHFGVDLTDEEAVAMGNRLLRLYAVLLRVPAPPLEQEGSNPVALDRPANRSLR
jgi:hypothetical protein